MWCWRKNEMAIWRRAERSMVRVMCSIKLVDKRNTVEQLTMDILGLKKAADKLAMANGVRYYSQQRKASLMFYLHNL